MINDSIQIIGAKENNLQNLSISIPKNKFVVITGVSGSGKSSLAFNTIYAEGQRRFLDTLSSYARQFTGKLKKPDVDYISGLSPVVAIEQKTISNSARSTVGTITEIYDFLRLLYAKIGEPYSYHTGKKMISLSYQEIVALIQKKFSKKKIILLAPLVQSRKGHYRELFKEYQQKGFSRIRVDGDFFDINYKFNLDRYANHDIELQVDAIEVNKDNVQRLETSILLSFKLGNGTLYVYDFEEKMLSVFSQNIICEDTGLSYNVPSPNTFSFNSPYGYCKMCKGIGYKQVLNKDTVIPDDTLSIQKGGILPLKMMENSSIQRVIDSLFKKNKTPLSKPISKLPQNLLQEILYGTKSLTIPKVETKSSKQDFIKDAYEDVQHYVLQNTKKDFKGVEYYLLEYLNNTSLRVSNWIKNFLKNEVCQTCQGSRLDIIGTQFKIYNKNIYELSTFSISKLQIFFKELSKYLSKKQNIIAKELLNEIQLRIRFICDIGLGYLTLDRISRTLSGGEAQRIRLATQISSNLQGITFILDEPSIGLHPRDNNALIKALRKLQQMGNSIIVVEHDKDIMLHSDYLIDIGPDAGIGGGKIVYKGTSKGILKSDTITSEYLNGKKDVFKFSKERKEKTDTLKLIGASGNNLKKINVKFPLRKLIVVTGVSGSGKSSLIIDTLYPILAHHSKLLAPTPLAYKSIQGLEHINKVVEIDQTPIGRTSRSNPATYCGFFSDIRNLFSQLPESKIRGYKPGRFSFNVKGGRCEECVGGGFKTIEMSFLPNVEILCPICLGKRYNRETLDIIYNGKNISQILEMNVHEAVHFFRRVPYIHRKLKVLEDVRLGYLKIGQSSLTLSGGEAQRVKLATELSKKDTGKTFYILDEPTTGLHFQDIDHLILVLNRLVDRGNTVVVIEHNLDVIKVANYIIDLGNEGGEKGGYLIASGTPEEVANNASSLTGAFLKKELENKKKYSFIYKN